MQCANYFQGPIGPLPYTIHIIISSRPVSSHFRPPQPVRLSQPVAQNDGQPPQNPPVPAQQMDPHSTLEQAQRVQAVAQAQLNMMQQQMAMFNPTLAQGMGPIPQNFNATIQIQGQQMQLPHHTHPHHPRPASTNPLERTNAMHGPAGQQRQEQTQPGTTNIQAHPNQPNNIVVEQQTLNAVDTLADPLAGLRLSHGLDPMPRPSSAPGNPPPRSDGAPRAPRNAQAPSMGRSSQVFGPINLPFPPHTHLPFPFATHTQPQSTSHTQPTVWLASSRNGPEALLFAPGHGYYTSAPMAQSNITTVPPSTVATASMAGQTTTSQSSSSLPQPEGSGPVAQPTNAVAAQPAAHPEPNAQVARVQRQLDRQRNANIDNDDIFAFIIQRGWLFLRLYMFMFVLSEPGTWRRYLLLFLAVIVCILPRRNPLNDAFAAARRHVDNLIGPPHPQPRDRLRQRQGQGNGNERPFARANLQLPGEQVDQTQAENASQAGPSTNAPTRRQQQPQGAVNTTPEETAQRLLREHEQRNPPNFILNFFYRIEQAIALFLASLIPGVGERHVAAREEVRREEERARLEEQANREAEEKKAKEEEVAKVQEGLDGRAGPSTEVAGPSSDEKGKGKERDVVEDGGSNAFAPTTEVGGPSAQAGSSSAVEARQEGDAGDVRSRFT